MKDILCRFLSKSFSELAPNATISNAMVANAIKTAASTQDFLENTCKKEGNKPNADIIFKRIKQCDPNVLKTAFKLIMAFMIKRVKYKFNRRGWDLAIDSHYEAFYGEYKDEWIHGYKADKGCEGSYKFITIAVVIGDERFTLMALPESKQDNLEDLVEELVLEARKHLRLRVVLFDRWFYNNFVIRRLKELKIPYLIMGRLFPGNKKVLEDMDPFTHKYILREVYWRGVHMKHKLLFIKDFIDFTDFKIHDWLFATNLSNIKAYQYVFIYKKRWGIETTYKMFGNFRIPTCSRNHIVRYFLFIAIIVLYNWWKFYNLLSENKITFKTFVYYLFLSSLNLDHIQIARDKIDEFFDLI